MSEGYIYIMTNPCLHDMVKIGYASDVEARRKQLSTTALPFEYEIYATYETSGQLEDKKLHELIDTLNPKLRLAKNREFFAIPAEKAYRLLEAIAIISGSAEKLKRVAPIQGEASASSSRRQTHSSGSSGRKQRPAINFQKCGIPVGAELVFIDDDSVRATVVDAEKNKVEYNGETTSLSPLAEKLRNVSAIQGASVFTYNGKKITDIAEETQWKKEDTSSEAETDDLS
ncbi:GIY-YIG nuclease family protein [Ruminococcus sp. RTP21484sp1_RTP31023st1_H8_RTP31023_210422]|uniref:GIY-YIG nuclease family protein n=1 Tax=Ruminococcus sp. RTP21484sp1_RTP31023st1_H8_RTP31023_210422 TaxID=3141611 RepID=UPI0034A3AD23